ncbi:FAD-dependent oxidoreductase [Halioglobus japonicus]|uniref:Pyridine nucleotide-disulfide oxidoreductase domain-containing protein 2 n=1 Tax=Halioglobus japonicus TaxID=930805 RepID=A0AAP8SP59_9GAMM|nr:NAD(P)/FAD-dependent oxidoreductase [Halioglobus japonicus]AQA19572.1 FAD-dependent oxidoreductase [Halioglobus japonicus]PLW87360.1 NAD(P)/FAD-dependent oxidoreductase [Halioglobus japonicus]GHD08882.1 FAD-dependent oxidoreductase [Halioglobus japonicus]
MPRSFDAVIVGGGHNGLTTANYLAMGGMRVCVLEQRDVVGGAAVSEEFHPGYRNSLASYVVSLLRPEVVRDLELERYGYQPILLENSLYLDSAGDYLLLNGDEQHDRAEYQRFSDVDYDAMEAFEESIDTVGGLLAKQWLKTPPKIHGGGLGDLLEALKLGLDAYRLSENERWRLLQFFIGAPQSIIDRWFESPKVKAMVAAHIMPANYAPLTQPGASLAMLHHAVGEIAGRKGAWGIVRGGMGAITQAMAASARDKGVEIRTGAAVEKILVENGGACGVLLADGERINAPVIAANTDPKRTFLTLLGEEHLPDSFGRDIKAFRQESASLRMNLALRGLPEFAALPGSDAGPQHRASITLIESMEHLDQAYRSSRAGIPADPPIIEAIIPSTMDDSLTDAPGTHVMSLLCKYMPYDLADGAHWDDRKPQVVKAILDHVTKFIPNLPDILVASQCLTPLDLERTFGMTRGDICHGRLEPDQLYSARPHPQAAQYATPMPGLYLCGSGAHPGGGVTGAPGHNAAQRILRDRR